MGEGRYELSDGQRSRIEGLLPVRADTVGRTALDNLVFEWSALGASVRGALPRSSGALRQIQERAQAIQSSGCSRKKELGQGSGALPRRPDEDKSTCWPTTWVCRWIPGHGGQVNDWSLTIDLLGERKAAWCWPTRATTAGSSSTTSNLWERLPWYPPNPTANSSAATTNNSIDNATASNAASRASDTSAASPHDTKNSKSTSKLSSPSLPLG
jgi:hypothetical protein